MFVLTEKDKKSSRLKTTVLLCVKTSVCRQATTFWQSYDRLGIGYKFQFCGIAKELKICFP